MELLKKKKNSEEILSLPEFYMLFPNSISIVKGTLLKQNLLLAIKDHEIAILSKNKADILTTTSSLKKSRSEYCSFVKKAIYVD